MANLTRYRGTGIAPWQTPPCGADIDWTNHFARGLSFCTLLNERAGNSTIDLVSKKLGTATITSTTMWQGGLTGSGVVVAGGSGNGLIWKDADSVVGDVTAAGSSAQFSVEALVSFNTTTLPVNANILAKSTNIVGGGAQGGWLARVDTAGGNNIDFVALDSGSAGLNMRLTFTGLAVNKLFHLVWVYNKGTGNIYVNGRFLGTGSGTPGSISNTRGIQLGRVTDNSSPFPGTIYHGRVWTSRALSGIEVSELYNDPYGMFVCPGRRIVNAKFFATGRRRFVNMW